MRGQLLKSETVCFIRYQCRTEAILFECLLVQIAYQGEDEWIWITYTILGCQPARPSTSISSQIHYIMMCRLFKHYNFIRLLTDISHSRGAVIWYYSIPLKIILTATGYTRYSFDFMYLQHTSHWNLILHLFLFNPNSCMITVYLRS